MTSEDAARTRRYVERLDRRRTTLADEVADDVAQVRGLTMVERGEWIASVCRAAWAIIRSREDAPRVLRGEPPAPDYEGIWRGLAARRARTEPSA